MTRQLEVMHHDGTMTYWPLEEPGAHWKSDPLLGLIHYERGGSDRTHIPWASIKYYHVVTRDDRAQKESDEQQRPTAFVVGAEGAHYCFGRASDPCDFCGYPDELPLAERRRVVSVWRSPEMGRSGDVPGDAAERGEGAEGEPDAGSSGSARGDCPAGDGV